MKKIIFPVFALCFLLFACKKKQELQHPEVVQEKIESPEAPQDTIPRASITFIMGKDASGYNQYYTLANYYYRLNPADKTEIVVDSLRSILEVCNFLRNHPPKNDRPYGLINLVGHGNEFVDLSARVYPGGPRTSVETLQQALRDSVFTCLDTAVVDAKTVVSLHGCGVGNNTDLVGLLALAFGSRQNGVKVQASKLFEYYAYLSKNKNPQSIRHYFAKAWYAFYNPDFAYGKQDLTEQLMRRYPEEQIRWEEGLDRRLQSNPGEIYHFSFIIPVIWEEIFDKESDMPELNSKVKKTAWLADNKAFTDLLSRTRIPREYFQFKYYKSKFDEDGKTYYELTVKARVGVICLIQPLIAPESDSYAPFQPSENDSLYFEVSKGKPESELLNETV
jgi:hypothetical protein